MSQNTLPNTVGISLKPQHYQEILEIKPDVGWFEVHPENYMGAGGLPHRFLHKIHQHYPVSMHGVGLSLGSADGICEDHLNALKTVIDRHAPEQVSEHLAWSHWNGIFLNDLLPIPYTLEFLDIVVTNILRVQDKLQRPILIENPSIYIGVENQELTETDFLNEVVKKTGCSLLLDINNVFVSANNLDFDAKNYLKNYPLSKVNEIHLAGHAQETVEGSTILIDDHGSSVNDQVWELFAFALEKLDRATPVLIEWDTNIPSLTGLLTEAEKAKKIINQQFLKAVS